MPVPDASDRALSKTLRLLIDEARFAEPILVTRPTLPALHQFQVQLAEIWESAWLTNNGRFHQRFEHALAEYLGVEHLSLFCNGTIALLVALQALGVTSGEVITTPFTFPATPHALHWNGVTPVFADVEPVHFTLDPSAVEAVITPKTSAIVPVHVYGHPCRVDAIQAIADRHGLKVIYDGAHAFGVRMRGRSIAEWGDCTMLSFHATKLFSSIEGGALVSRSRAAKVEIDYLKNFGIADEETVVGPGINGKLNELQSAYGLLQLEMIDDEIERRRVLVDDYRRGLLGIPGVYVPPVPEIDRNNFAYLPILLQQAEFGVSRDELHELFKRFNVFTRKYFHPLCSRIPVYRDLPSSRPERLPVAEDIARRILCLPIYGTLERSSVQQICAIIAELHRSAQSRSPTP